MDVIEWLLEGDPAIRWQVLRDLTDASPDEVDAERARVAFEGWGARLLALQGDDGLWEGGACFPAAYAGGEPGQPCAVAHARSAATEDERLRRRAG